MLLSFVMSPCTKTPKCSLIQGSTLPLSICSWSLSQNYFVPCTKKKIPGIPLDMYVLTSVSLSLELLLMEGLDSPHGLSLSLQVLCPGFSCKNMRKPRLNTKKQALNPDAKRRICQGRLSAEISSQKCENWHGICLNLSCF